MGQKRVTLQKTELIGYAVYFELTQLMYVEE